MHSQNSQFKNQNNGSIANEIAFLKFTHEQAILLEKSAIEIALAGGPQATEAQNLSRTAADEIITQLDDGQLNLINLYASGDLSLLVFENMICTPYLKIPDELPSLEDLTHDIKCLTLASRSQLLLNMVDNRAFAFDLDNSELVRFVGNFKGGGKNLIANESNSKNIELSSHAGVALTAHTEPPYNCVIKFQDGHSPAPSTLILTARWNPKDEPTTVIPLFGVIDNLSPHQALSLTSNSFNYTRTESFAPGKGSAGGGIPILSLDERGRFVARYNSYRFSIDENKPQRVREAYSEFKRLIHSAPSINIALQPSKAIAINNGRALHCRDSIDDNRRLLIRLFGYSKEATEIVISENPLIAQG